MASAAGRECTRRPRLRPPPGGPEARYSGGMTRLRNSLAMTATLAFVSGAPGWADDEINKSGAETEEIPLATEEDPAAEPRHVPALSVMAAQGFSGSPGMQAGIFGRAGMAIVNVALEDSVGPAAGMPDDTASLTGSDRLSEFGWGVGARLMSGSWGIEGSYNILESVALSPGWALAEEAGGPEEDAEVMSGLFDLPLVPSRAGTFVGQLVRTFRLTDGTVLSLGAGAGWMRVTDSSTDRLLSGVGLPDPAEITGELPSDVPPELVAAFTPEIEFTADRSGVVYAGSLGVSFRFGRILLRPRVDVIIAPALTTELTLSFPGLADLGVPEAELDAAGFRFTTSVTPRIYLLSVDIGLGN